MDIAGYLSASGLSPEAFGELIGHHGTTVRRWLNGGEIKSGDIKKMVAITKGKISADAILRASSSKDDE